MTDAAPRKSLWRRLTLTPRARISIGATTLLLIGLCSLVVPLVLRLDPNGGNPMNLFLPPSATHPLGTDGFGRDMLTRILFGTRISLLVGVVASVGTFFIGMPLGMLAAFVHVADEIVMRVVDALLSLPPVLLAIAFMAVLGAGLTNVLVVLLIAWTPLTIRMARSATLEVLPREYVEAAGALGASVPSILYRHVLRNAIDAVLVQQTVAFVGGIIGEATFSFIGAGVQPPAASLGSILGDAQANFFQAPWLGIYPGIVLVIIALSAVLVGDGLRDLTASSEE